MASDEDKARDNYECYRYCRMGGHDAFLSRAATAYDFYANRQWTDAELAEMRATGRPALTINQTFRTLDSIVGEMLYSTGDVRFTPSSVDAQDDAADALDKIWVNVNQQSKTQFFEPQLLLDGLLTGRAYYDIRVDFDNSLQGQIKITRKRSQNIVLSPQINSRDPDDWPEVFETSYTSIDSIERLYGAAAANEIKAAGQCDFLCPEDRYEERMLSDRLTRNSPTNGFDYTRAVNEQTHLMTRRLIQRQYRTNKYKEFFVEPTTGDMTEVPENWDRNRIAAMVNAAGVVVIKRLASTIRWRVSCDRFILHDEDSPYNHFTIVPFFPWFVDGYTMSLGENLIDMQRMTNKLYSQYLHILNSAANSGWKVKAGSLQNMSEEQLKTDGAQTGLVAVLTDVNDMERIEPGVLPQGHDTLAATVRSMFDDVSGYTNTMKGADRADAAGKAIDAKIARGAVNLATAYNAIYHAKTMLAERTLDLAQSYYTETRFLRISQGYGAPNATKTINQPTPEGGFLNDICVGKYAVAITPAAQRDTVEQNAFQQLVQMRQDLGMVIPDDVLLQYSALPDKKKIQDAIANAGGTPEQQAQKAQLEQQMSQAELENTLASAENSRAQALLAKSRAGKAQAEASQDPNTQRATMDAARLAAERERDQRSHELEQRGQDINAATKLTEIELKHQRENRKIESDREVKLKQAAQKPKAAPKPKPATTKRK